MNFKVKFHKSLCHQHGIKEEYEKELNEQTEVITAIRETLRNTEAFNLIFNKNEKIKTGYLIISKGKELTSTNQLDEKINKFNEVKIIPIYHGG